MGENECYFLLHINAITTMINFFMGHKSQENYVSFVCFISYYTMLLQLVIFILVSWPEQHSGCVVILLLFFIHFNLEFST